MPNRDRILVVEDDRDTLGLLFNVLNHQGFSVLTADDGQQAMDLLLRGIRPRLLILDLMMPRVSGVDVLSHMRSDPDLRTVPTIVVTGMRREQVRVVADRILYKPIDVPELVRAVHALSPPTF